MRVFLDANVLFSAAYRETGSVRPFFRLAAAGTCELVSSGYAADEARRNILVKHPGRISDLELLVAQLSICREPMPGTIDWAKTHYLPLKDAPILAAAVEARCQLLVTGDRSHFGKLFGRRLRGTIVLLPVEALELLLGPG
jgi:predicted nucleic acid-binding protein